ncbi:MAG TPA: Ig-like domain-containing protein [Fermentimonas sp.]|nr:Ig-like domain-containing protein [Fermentimonas sp.]
MKKSYLFLFLSVMVCSIALAQLPQGGKNYNIKNVGADLYLSYYGADDWNVSRINAPTGDIDQVWRLVATEEVDVFNLSIDGQYLTKHPNNGWDNVLTADPTADEAKFVLTEEESGITIQLLANRGTGSYYAPQGSSAGSAIYLDSGGGADLELWVFEEVVEADELDVKTLTPAEGATGISYISPTSVLFTKDIVAGDLSGITIKDAAGEAVADVIATLNDDATISIAHADFDYETTYTVTIPQEAIEGFEEEVSWSFTTMAELLPELSVASITPAADATDIALNATVETVFNQSITASDLTGVTIKDAAGEAVADVIATLNDDATISIAHADFDYETTYTVTIPQEAIEGFEEEVSWSFTTMAIGPLVVSTTPDNGAEDVLLTTPISVSFDQTITVDNLNGVIVTDEEGNHVGDVVSTSGSTLNIAHTSLSNSTLYTVTIPANSIKGVTAEIKFSFTTEDFINSLDGVNKDADITVYPAISAGSITVSSPAKATISIIDIAGVNRATYQTDGSLIINMNYPNGIYFVVVDYGNGFSAHKVLLRKSKL